MLFHWWRKLVNRKPTARGSRRKPRRFSRMLYVERLEDRSLLSAPTIASTNPAPIFSGSPALAWSSNQIRVAFNSSLALVGAGTASNYDLRSLGPDHLVGTADDVVILLSVTYASSTETATLSFSPALAVSADPYQLTVFDNITDSSGTKLDGNGDGTPGGNFVRSFNVVPASLSVAGFPVVTTAGLAGSFTVTALDGSGGTAAGYRGTVHFTASTSGSLPSDYTFTAADAGTHTFSAALYTAGTGKSITATDASVTTVTGKQTGITVNSGDAASFNFTLPASTSAGVAFSATLTAKDAYGNVATGYTGTVDFISSDVQAVLPSDYSFSAADAGAHTFTFTLDTAGNRSINVTDAVNASLTKTSTSTVNPAAASTLSINGPTSATAGSSFSIVVTALDPFGNTATGYLGTVHLTSNDAQAVLPADYMFAATDSGAHTFSITLKTAGVRSVTATDTTTATITGTESGITVSPANASKLSVAAPTAQTAGTSFTNTVTAQDAYGNTAPNYTGTVHFTSNDLAAALPTDYAFLAADAGIHSFNTTLYTAGSRTITATDTVTATITGKQSGIVVSPAVADHYLLSNPGAVTAGTPVSITLTVKDAYGNTATGYAGTVHFISTDAQAALPADYTFTPTDAGVHSFSVTLKTAGAQTITATDTTSPSVIGKQSGISVSHAAASQLVVTNPVKPATGAPFNVTVSAADPYGNADPTYTGTVHLTSTDPQAVLPADYSYTDTDAGTHVFSVTFNTAGTQTLTATDNVANFTGSLAITPSPYRYSTTSNSILVTGPISVTLSSIASALPNAPLFLVDAVNHIWFLKANLILGQGATLKLHGSSIGGDVDQLRLLSDNVAGPNAIVKIDADWGDIDIKSTAITSWDEAANGGAGGPDTEIATYGRAYIQVRSSLAADRVTPRESRMDIDSSDIGYLGYNNEESYGLSWKVIGDPGAPLTDANGNPTFQLYELVNVYGNVTNNHIHNMFFGAYTFGSFQQQFLNNEVDHDVGYGLDFHDDSDQLLVQNNYVHDNGFGDPSDPTSQFDGIIASKRCDHVQFLNNLSVNNAQNGLFLHLYSNDGVIAYNRNYNNGEVGISLFASERDSVHDNEVRGNRVGLRLNNGARYNQIYNNTFDRDSLYGVQMFIGTDPRLLGDGRNHDNFIHDNVFSNTAGFVIRAIDSDNNLFQHNDFSLNNGDISFLNAVGNRFDGNVVGTVPPAAVQSTSDPTISGALSSTFLSNQPNIRVQVDLTSTTTLTDAGGKVFDVQGAPTATTISGTSGSVLSLLAAQIGTFSTQVLTRNLAVTTGVGDTLLVTPILWKTDTDHRKTWTAQSSVLGQPNTYSVGDLVAGTSYLVKQNGVVIATLTADATGTVTFTDSPNTTAAVAYSVETPAVSVQLTSFPTSTVAGQAQSFIVTALDAAGNVATGYTGTLHFSTSDGQGGVPADYMFIAADAGSHIFSATLKTAGTQSLTVSDGAFMSSVSASVSPAGAKTFTVGGIPATLTAGDVSGVTVTAFDPYGNIATGYLGTVHFTSTDSNATLPADYTFRATDAGTHTFASAVTLVSAGSRTVTVTDTVAATITGKEQGIVVNPQVGSALVVAGFSDPVSAGNQGSFTVTVKDIYGNVVTGYLGTVQFTSTDPMAMLPASYTFVASDLGTHIFNAILFTTGSQTITATDTVGGFNGKQSAIHVTAAASANFALTGLPSSVAAGTSNSVTLTVRDQFGNLATNYTGTVHFMSTDAQAILPPDYSFTVADGGNHTFSITLKTAGTQSVTAGDGTASTQASSLVTAITAKTLAVGGIPGSVVAGALDTLTVTALDQYGNVAGCYLGTIHFTSTDLSATLPSDYTFTAGDAGSHTFINGVTLVSAGARTVTATDTATPTILGKEQNIVVTPAAAAGFVLSGYPTAVAAGTTGSFTVTAKDAFGNVATGYTGMVHFTSSDAQASLPVDYTFKAGDAGVHSFGVTLYTAGSQSITATDTANAAVTGKQSAIQVSALAASQLVVIGYPSPTVAGTSQNFTVSARDVYGNLAATFTGAVHFTSSDALATLPLDYTFVAADGGDKIFSITLRTAGPQSITAGDAVDGFSASQSGIIVTAAAAKNFAVSGFTIPVVAGNASTFTVTSIDPYGNMVTGYTGTVHFTTTDLSSQVVLPADYMFTAADNGSHVFSATLVSAGTRTITATETADASIIGKQQNIVVLPAAAVSFVVSGFTSPATAGSPGSFDVTAKDAFGNLATGYTGAVHFTAPNDPTAQLPSNYTFTGAEGGVQTFTATFYTSGSQTIVATDTSNATLAGKQSAIQVGASTPATILVANYPTPTTAGTSQNFEVIIKDVYGNTARGYVGTVHFSSDDPLAVLPADYTFTAADLGDKIFSATFKTAGLHSLTATESVYSLSGCESGISVTAAATAHFIVGGFANPVTAGQASTFNVTATDAYGNYSSYLGTVHFAATDLDPRVVLPGDYTFTPSDNGTHTFSATLISAGLRTITATDKVDGTILGKQQFIQVNGAAAAYFLVTTPSSVIGGEAFDLTVNAKDQFGNFTSNYLGTVTFSSDDEAATVPDDYTFTAADAGVHTFTLGATFFQNGIRDIVATDTLDPTITGKSSSSVVNPAYLWVPATNTIYVSGVTTTLSTIHAQLPTAALSQVDLVNHIWQLDANLLLLNGAELDLHGTAIGGDVDQLRLRSNNYHNPDGTDLANDTIWIKASYGTIDIDTTKITSWDEALNAPDTNPGVIPPRPGDDDTGSPIDTSPHMRSFISVRSFFAPDGITPLHSEMDIKNSDIGYLGSHTTEGYGLSWKALGLGPIVHSHIHVYGSIINSHIHNNFFGAFIYGGYQMQILNNEVDHNIWYGLDPHDDTDYTDMEYNYSHDNGTHGIIFSQRCDHNIIAHNIVTNNAHHGIMLHRSSNDNVVDSNIVTGNGEVGIALYESFHNTVTNNTIENNQKGVRFSMGAADNNVGPGPSYNAVSDNEIAFNSFDGIDFLTGNDAPNTAVDPDRRPHDNEISNNLIHDNGQYAIRVTNADENTFEGNNLYNETAILVATSSGNVFRNNTLPAGLVFTASGSTTNFTDVTIQSEPSATVRVTDSFSSFNFGDTVGTIVDAGPGEPGTSITSSGSQMVLTQANIGNNTVTVVPRNFMVDVQSGAPNVTVKVNSWSADAKTPRIWTTVSGDPAQLITYIMPGLAPSNFYTVSKNGTMLSTIIADSTGTIKFKDSSGSTSAVTYQVVASNKPNLPPVQASNVSYSASTATITITGAVTATLTQLAALLPTGPSAPLVLVDATNHIWYLKASVILKQGALLALEGSSIGGDVDELRLLSNNATGVGNVVSIQANWGYIDIDHTKVTSWDTAANGGLGGPDTEYATFQRAYISAISFLDPDGVTAHSSYLNVNQSDVGYLGYSSNPGLLWTVNSSNPAVLATVHVFGNVNASRIHDSYYGLSTKGADSGVFFLNNEIDHNAQNGVNLKFYSNQVDIEGNNVHNNGGTGINISTNCTGVTVHNNTVQNNLTNGIEFQLASGSGSISGNQVLNNGSVGILISGSDSILVQNNTALGNVSGGLRLDKNTGMTLVTENEFGLSKNGLQIQNGSGSGTNPDGSSRANTFASNNIHDNGSTAITISSANNNVFRNNLITRASSQKVTIKLSTDNVFTGNIFSDSTTVATTGSSTFASRTDFVNQKASVTVDAYSSLVFTDTTGGIFKVGALDVATLVSAAGSTVTITRATIGSSTVLVSTRHLTAVADAGTAQIDANGWNTNPTSSKSFTVLAGTTTQNITYTLGDLTPGARYTVMKNGVVLLTVTADANGFATFTDVAGTLSSVTYSIIPS
jgi:parallel beta-helix repeat protein